MKAAKSMPRGWVIWGVLIAAIIVPIALAAVSPLLAWRQPIYIIAGFAGIIGLCLLLVQPLIIGGHLPGISAVRRRRTHRWIGGTLVAAIIVHVGGPWITSPPDVIDALLFSSPTPFSAWGVVAMWAIFATALLATLRRRLLLSPWSWRYGHGLLAIIIIIGSVIHSLQIEGTMETISKIVLCTLVVAATFKVIADLWQSTRRTPSR